MPTASRQNSTEFHEKLRQAYRALAAEEPKRCVVIDGRAPREVVSERIWSLVHERLLTPNADMAETVGAVSDDETGRDESDIKLPRETTVVVWS